MNSEWIEAQLEAVEVIARQMRRRYAVGADEYEDMLSEGYVALCVLAKQADGNTPPSTQEVIRRTRNAMSAHMMRLMRKPRTSVLRTDYPEPETGESQVEQAIRELDLIDRLAILAYLRGVDVRAINKALGVSYRRINHLITEVFGD